MLLLGSDRIAQSFDERHRAAATSASRKIEAVLPAPLRASAQPERSTSAGSAEVGLIVDDVDRVWQDGKTKGVKLLTHPEDLPFGRAFDARDPEGHRLTVFKPPLR